MADELPVYDDRCKSKTDLEEFYGSWLTYISQIFGDEEVRNLIQEIYQDPDYKLEAELQVSGQPFAGYEHHIVVGKKKNSKIRICSAEQGYQNIGQNKGDMLCQSYALLNYFKIPMDKTDTDVGHWRNQMKMIKLYNEKFLNNLTFITRFNELIKKIQGEKPARWFTYVGDKTKPFKFGDNIIEKIKEMLKLWHDYGYWTFIKDGSCKKEDHFAGLKVLYGNNQTLGSRKRSSLATGTSATGTSRSVKSRRLSTMAESPTYGGYKKRRKTFKKTARKITRKRKLSRRKRV